MESNLFVFFAGIALSLGLIEIWLGISNKKFGKDFIFGLPRERSMTSVS